jgi:hypothetical protein
MAACAAYAQTSSGSIAGTVYDPSGAVIPGAQIKLSGTETGELVRTLTTDDTGAFTAPLLRPSVYTVEASAQGFKTLKRAGILLRVDDTLSLKLTLDPGSTTESINVTAAAEMLEEKSNTVGQIVDEKTMQQLPLNGRNYLQLGSLAAGAVPSRSRDRTISAYGNRGLQNAFLLDGARNQSYLRGLDNRQRDAMRPQLEAIAEFKVQTSNYSAEYGASAGSVINVVTKSGTNEIHGSAFEFLRNNKMDARDFFLPATSKQPLYIQHQFGGSLGGPFIKNRAWWQGAFQRTHISEGETNIATVPLATEKAGVFGLPVYDPATTRANPAGAGFVRDLFPNNTIPAARLDRVGKPLMDRYPAPNLPGAARNYVSNPLQATRSNNATGRADLRVSDADSVFFRFSLDDGTFNRLPVLPLGAQTGTNRETPARSYGVGYTRILSPSMVNEARFAYNYIAVNQDGTQPLENLIPGALDPRVTSAMPTFAATGYATLGDQPAGFSNVPLYKSSKVWNFSDNFSLVKNKHTLKMGVDFQMLDIPTFATLNGRGAFGFTGVFTQNPQRRPGSGSGLADLLLGLPNSITLGSPSDANERANNLYFYVQDDWTISPRLTLNFGLRYELTRPFWDKNDRLANLVLDSGHPLYGQYVLAGDSRMPRSLMETDKNNFAPRFGFAWRPPVNGTVVRGGFGIFFAQDEAVGVSQRITNNPPFVGFGGIGLVSDQLNISSTIPLSGQLPQRPASVDPASYRFDPRSTVQIRSWLSNFTLPYVAQWNLSIQKELTKTIVWEINYVGNRGVKLVGAYEANQPLPGPGSVNDRRPLAAITRASILRVEPWVNATYHGMSTRLEKRFSKGLSFLGVYTFGRALDTQSNMDLCQDCVGSNGFGSVQDTRNRRLNYGLADHHIAHRFVLSGNWELPFRAPGVAGHIVRGWALSGISTMQTGQPITLTLNFDNANTGTTNWPNRLGSGKPANQSINNWINAADFAFPAQYTFGNAGRNIMTGPGFQSTDVSLQRNFELGLTDRSRIEFRAEAFNVFNTPQFGNPNAALGNANFGTIGGTARSNRQMQLGLRFLF